MAIQSLFMTGITFDAKTGAVALEHSTDAYWTFAPRVEGEETRAGTLSEPERQLLIAIACSRGFASVPGWRESAVVALATMVEAKAS